MSKREHPQLLPNVHSRSAGQSFESRKPAASCRERTIAFDPSRPKAPSSMISILASTIVAVTALYFASFATACFFAPSAVERFLGGFARSGLAHYGELGADL